MTTDDHSPKGMSGHYVGDFNQSATIYNLIALYDTHYSTVRVGVVSLMLTIATVSGGYLLDKQPQWALVIGVVFLALGMLLNLHFYSLTKACYLLQRNLESGKEIIVKSERTPPNAVEIRKSILLLYSDDRWTSAYSEDLPTKIYVWFSVCWFILLIINIVIRAKN